MARVVDLWHTKTKKRTARYGKGSRWQAVWNEPGGDEVKKSFKTRDAAEEHLTWVEHQRRSGNYVSARSAQVFIGPLLDQWLKTLTHLKPSSRESVEQQVRSTLRPELGSELLSSLTGPFLQDWLNNLERGARTKELVRTFLHQFCQWAVQTKRIGTNPAVGLKLPRSAAREKQYLTPAQVKTLVLSVTGHFRDHVLFLALTGLRIGELIELRVRDFDAAHGRFTVNRSAVFLPGGVRVGTPKSGKARTIAAGKRAHEILARLCAGKGPDDLIFTSTRGTRVDPKNFKRRHFDPAVKKAKIVDGFRVHDLRHTAASWAIRAGATVLAVQRMLGHASPKITLEVYAELFDQDLEVVAEAMDGLAAELTGSPKNRYVDEVTAP